MTRSRIALIALVVVASACNRTRHDSAFRWTNALPPGSVVHIRDAVGNINVKRVDGTQAVINGSRTWRRGRAKDVEFVVNQVGNDFYVCALWKNSGDCSADGYNSRRKRSWLSMLSLFRHGTDIKADFEVSVPASVRVDAKTASGSVTVSGTSGGVNAETANGSVTITGASGGVSAESANGSVTASNVSGALTLKTANGSVRASSLALGTTDAVTMETANGDVRLELPAGTDGKFSLTTVSGSVKSDFPLTSSDNKTGGAIKNLFGQIGTSNRELNMHTVNGSVVVTSRPATASQ